jgi:hypothetical protein
MTPLAYELLKDLTTPGAFRVGASKLLGETNFITNRKSFWSAVTAAHFFDLSAVEPLVQDVSTKMREAFDSKSLFSDRLAFLPAPVTWLEFYFDGGRETLLLAPAANEPGSAAMSVITKHFSGGWMMMQAGGIPLVGSNRVPSRKTKGINAQWQPYELDTPRSDPVVFRGLAALALINAPRIIGNRQHMPHERIEREKLKSLGLVGKFPLHAWTEIVLKVAPPDLRTGEPSTEGHLTGEKCLHFVRTFLRVRMGQLEYVDAHWRGNPALGMKRSRYRVEPESDHA